MTGTRKSWSAWARTLPLLAAVLLAAGCSTGNGNSGLNLITPGGSHPAGFVTTHPSLILSSSDTSLCQPCHGAALDGGIAKVSCFSHTRNGVACHHSSPTWGDPAEHGASAKLAPGHSSFIVCKICHGNDFAGGGSGVSCVNFCHTSGSAPHPGNTPGWITGGTYTHTNTDPVNAVVCSDCHAGGVGINPPHPPLTPAPAGTAPGCFNSTLCHGAEVAPHILGATWLNPTSSAFHGISAKADLAFCQTCHGTTGTIFFDGGVAATKCSNCHTAAKAHPTTWYQAPGAFPSYVASHRDSGNRSVACAICHNVTAAGAGPMAGAPSCFSASFTNALGVAASCHLNGPGAPNHAVPYFDNVHFQATSTTFTTNCGNCHAVTGTSPVSSAPLCTVCHTGGSPLALTACTSCHANPPGGATGTYPNVAGAHATHLGLNVAGTPVACNTCHNGLGTNTLNHYNRANARPGSNALRVAPGDLAFLAAYSAKTGASSFDNAALSCGNISCHGGTPRSGGNPGTALNWQTGTLVVDSSCTSCHAFGTAQFNGASSGQHGINGDHSLCTNCHSTTKLASAAVGKHFLNLGTSAIDTRASVTISGTGTSIPEGNYTPGATVGTGSCTPSCHGTESW